MVFIIHVFSKNIVRIAMSTVTILVSVQISKYFVIKNGDISHCIQTCLKIEITSLLLYSLLKSGPHFWTM